MYLYNGCVLSHLYVVFFQNGERGKGIECWKCDHISKNKRELNIHKCVTLHHYMYLGDYHYTITCTVVCTTTPYHTQQTIPQYKYIYISASHYTITCIVVIVIIPLHVQQCVPLHHTIHSTSYHYTITYTQVRHTTPLHVLYMQ